MCLYKSRVPPVFLPPQAIDSKEKREVTKAIVSIESRRMAVTKKPSWLDRAIVRGVNGADIKEPT
jgi:hypothetical protein